MIQSYNRHAIRANVNKPSDMNVCDANDSYKVKIMPERKLCLLITSLSHFYDLKNLAIKKQFAAVWGQRN